MAAELSISVRSIHHWRTSKAVPLAGGPPLQTPHAGGQITLDLGPYSTIKAWEECTQIY